ncbi:DNA recombination mediator protein [Dehalogenimonas sp. WBC-2]|nr:DNA recombination mediator protein [Dehalogenimonas sp. WBC-2]
MTEPREIKTPAVVIRRFRLNDADRVITLFTQEMGKVSAIAKGVRKSTSKLAGHLEPLTFTSITLTRGKNLKIITGSQTIKPFLHIRNSLEGTAHALYYTELIYHFTPEDQPNPSVFGLLTEVLDTLDNVASPAILSRYFELNLLKYLGYQPVLRRCQDCGAELQSVVNYFSVAHGGILCPTCTTASALPLSCNGLKVIRFILENEFDLVRKLKCDLVLNREIQNISRSYLRYLLEKEPKSAAWLDELNTNISQ